ncbi:MAG TPA: hypothetical protein VLQ91_16575 [Draconibacterium sp.]|nr:hypothetical protein [Draconibacterium sp.]
MEKILKNKKGNKNFPVNSANNRRIFKYSLTNDKFVVPWQMEKTRKSTTDITSSAHSG